MLTYKIGRSSVVDTYAGADDIVRRVNDGEYYGYHRHDEPDHYHQYVQEEFLRRNKGNMEI